VPGRSCRGGFYAFDSWQTAGLNAGFEGWQTAGFKALATEGSGLTADKQQA